MDSEEPIVPGSLDDGQNEGIINNNNDVNEGSDMDTSGEATPILGGKKSEPVVAPAPSAEPVASAPVAAAPKKKSHAGLIITIIILAVLLIGGGVAAFLLLMARETPEVAINDAITKVFEAENKTISGTVTSNNGSMPVTIKIDGAQAGGDFSASGTITVAGLVNIDYSAAMIKDSNLYIKLDGVKKALKNLPLEQLFGGSSSSSSSMTELFGSIIESVGEVVDGEWIKVNIADLTGGSDSKCGASEISMFLNGKASKELAEAYKKNAFVVQKKDSEVKEEDGVKYYEIEVNDEKSAAFKKAIEETEFGKSLKKCVVNEGTEEEDSSKDASIVDSIKGKNAKIFIGVKPWSHDLVALKVENTDKSDKANADFKIGYEKKSIEEPSNAKTLDEIKGKLETAIKNGYADYIKSYAKKICQSAYGAYGSTYVDACVKQYTSSLEGQMGDFSIEDLMSGLGGGFNL